MFPQLADLVVGSVQSRGGVILVHVTSNGAPVECPGCGAAGRVHGYVDRQLADLPLAGHRVLVRLRLRRLRCPTVGCERQTFREPLPGLAEPYQRRTIALATQVGAVVRELAGRAGSRLLDVLGVSISRQSAVRSLLRLPLPVRPVPEVIGVDDFALRKRHRYATVIIDAVTRERIDVLADRQADTLEAWLRAHPGVRVVCRDSSGAYAEAIRRALPGAVQVGDRWHSWHNLAEAVVKEVAAHSVCWGKTGPPPKDGVRAATTRERWQQVHALLDQGVGLLECARRLGVALNTVKRYARISEPERLVRVPKYRPTLVDPFRDHLRRRRAEEPAVSVQQLLAEIRELGYTGSQNLLYRYINQGRVECDQLAISPKRLAGLLLSEPGTLTDAQRERLDAAIAACGEVTMLSGLVRDFAALLDPKDGNDRLLTAWIGLARHVDLPHVHAFTRGLVNDCDAVNAALCLPFHNGGTEGVNTKTKLLKNGRCTAAPGSLSSVTASCSASHVPSPPKVGQSRYLDRPQPGPLWTGQRGALTISGIVQVVLAVGADAKLSGLRPHRLRHTYATRLREGGADVAQVQALLGHASLDTSARYFRAGTAEQAAVVDRVFDPRSAAVWREKHTDLWLELRKCLRAC